MKVPTLPRAAPRAAPRVAQRVAETDARRPGEHVFLCATAAVLALAIGCVPPGGGSAGSSRGDGQIVSQRDEVRVVSTFADVRAVSVSRRYVFAATTGGISVYDRLFDRWLAPLARDGGLQDGQITFMSADPGEDAVWIGVPGAVLMYRPQTEQLQRTMITGVPDAIVFAKAAGGDAYVRASGQWSRLSRIGSVTSVSGPPVAGSYIVPSTLNEVYTRYPALRSGSPLLFRSQQSDRALRPYQVVAGAIAPDQPNDVWLGTNGDGLYRVDAAVQQATPLRYGLMERGVGAVALGAGGVWAAGLGMSSLRGGVSFATNDLQRWRWIDGTIAVPLLGVRATSLAVRAQRAWIGTDRGLVRILIDRTEAMARWTLLDGLPDDRVFAIAPRGDGAWVGTARGLVYVTDSINARNARSGGIGARLLENTPVYALQFIGDTLWIGTEAGLVALLPTGELTQPRSVDPALRRRVTALAWSDSVLLAGANDGVLQLRPGGAFEPTRLMALDVAQVGQLTRLAMDDRSIVMVGTDGMLVLQRAGGVRVLAAPRDIPGPVLDVALAQDWIWLATPDGLVRLRRAGDGGVP